jgi:hypothetical protein
MLTPSLYAVMYQNVRNFRQAFDLPLCPPATSDLDLHDRLRLEEFEEAVLADTHVQRLDALVDSAYVTLGECVQRGLLVPETLQEEAPELHFYLNLLIRTADRLKFDFAGAWNTVHAANMGKLVDEDNRAATTQRYAAQGIQVEYTPTCLPGKYIAKAANTTDAVTAGKLLKPAGFQAPNLIEFLG